MSFFMTVILQKLYKIYFLKNPCTAIDSCDWWYNEVSARNDILSINKIIHKLIY